MRLSYLFFHVRPFRMVAVFPFIIASQTDAAPLASYAGRMSATVIFAVGFVIFVWSHWQVYKPAQWPNDTPIPFLAAEPSRLVTDGTYRYVRNPQLIDIDLMLLGEAIFLWSLPLLAYSLLVCVASDLHDALWATSVVQALPAGPQHYHPRVPVPGCSEVSQRGLPSCLVGCR